MDTTIFRQMFAGVDGGYIGVASFRGNYPETEFFDITDLDHAYRFALEQNSQRRNVYISMKVFETIPAKGRGCASDPGYHCMAWVDLDYGVEGHKSDKNPPTRE